MYNCCLCCELYVALDHMKRSQELELLRQRTAHLDDSLAKFANNLAQKEQALYNAQHDPNVLKNLKGQIISQNFNVEELLVSAQRLSQTTYEAQQREGTSLALQSYPDHNQMQFSHLHASLDELQDALQDVDAFLAPADPPILPAAPVTRLGFIAADTDDHKSSKSISSQAALNTKINANSKQETQQQDVKLEVALADWTPGDDLDEDTLAQMEDLF